MSYGTKTESWVRTSCTCCRNYVEVRTNESWLHCKQEIGTKSILCKIERMHVSHELNGKSLKKSRHIMSQRFYCEPTEKWLHKTRPWHVVFWWLIMKHLHKGHWLHLIILWHSREFWMWRHGVINANKRSYIC